MVKLVPLRPQAEKNRRKMRKVSFKGGMILVGVLALMLFISYRLGISALYYLSGSVTAVEGALDTRWQGEALIARVEHVVAAPLAGRLEPVAPEGARVRVGEPVCRILDDEGRVVSQMTAAQAGMVSYRLDGLEHFAPGQSQSGLWESYRAGKTTVRHAGERVDAGAPVYKIVINDMFSVYIALEGLQELKVGQDLRVALPDGEQIMTIHQVEKVADHTLLEARSTVFHDATLSWRRLERLEVSRGRRYGLLIPAGAVVREEDGGAGVYLLMDGRSIYRSVEVLAENENEALVSGIPVGAQVVLRPRLFQLYLRGR